MSATTARDSSGATPQQHAAITTLDRSVVVIAGAGTGKTFVLVRRFVELLAQNPTWPVSAVVAITFTDRAANEMRSRVRSALESRLRNATTEAEIKRWSGLLAQIEAARITTIHGLCSEIVRANAAAAAIDPAFEVLDATQAALLREDAIALALAEAGEKNSALTDLEQNLLINIVTRYAEADIRKSLGKPALGRAELIPVRPFDALMAEWEAQAQKYLHKSRLPALTLIPPQNGDKFADKYSEALANLERMSDATLATVERFNALGALLKIPANVGSKKLWPDVDEAKSETRLLTAAAADIYKQIEIPPDAQDEEAAALLEGWMLFISRMQHHYNTLKTARAALDFDDLEAYAFHILKDERVRARYIGAEFKHVMVDEFQDTNTRQWSIVKAIAPPENTGALFIVGDPKQSIYGFRGADVTVFEKARLEIVAHGGDVLYLTQSFRTHQPLVEAMNAIFTHVMRAPDHAFNSGVYVRFDESQHLISNRENAPETKFIGAYLLGKEDKPTAKAIDREARAVAHEIREMVKNAAQIVWRDGDYQPVRYGDIALLMRSFTNVDSFEDALTEAGIPFITLGGQGFFGKREVRDLISALKALHNPSDELSLAAALHSPLFAVSDADLLRLRQVRVSIGDESPKPLPMFEALMHEAENRRGKAYDSLVFSADVLASLQTTVGRTTVETLLHTLINATGYMATLAGLPNGTQMRANVEKLIDRARDSGLTALNLFVRYLRDMTEAEAKEGGAALQAENAVRITTIHSSKGLEYPVVWLANASKEPRAYTELLNWSDELGCKLPTPDQKQTDKEKLHPYVYRRNKNIQQERENAEELRIFYVAATRAQDAFFISGQTLASGEAKGWLGAVKDLIESHVFNPPDAAPRANRVEAHTDDLSVTRDYPLAHTIPAAPLPSKLHLSASDITALGGASHTLDEKKRRQFKQRLRRRMLDEQSEPVSLLTYDAGNGQPSPQIVGTLTHDALRYGYDTLLTTDKPRVQTLIESMAWELGITQERDLLSTVDVVLKALYTYRRSALSRELENSPAVYRELPFVYQRDGHVLHGFIDLLYRAPDGVWTLVDFKTDRVKFDALTTHARIYHLQMAVYAEAVAVRTGQIPRVQLVFLKYPDAPVTLDPDLLRDELATVSLNDIIKILHENPSG